MTRRHIDFSSLEPGDSPDPRHLDACRECQEDWEALLQLRLHLSRSPRIEPSPFFAARIVKLALDRDAAPFFLFLQRTAQQLLPVFLALLLTVGLFYPRWQTPALDLDLENSQTLYVLLEDPPLEELTVNDIVAMLNGEEDQSRDNAQ